MTEKGSRTPGLGPPPVAGVGKGWWRPAKVAKHLDVHIRTVYRRVGEGDLEVCKIKGTLLISLESLEALIARNRVDPGEF